jgi:hypothetical protein
VKLALALSALLLAAPVQRQPHLEIILPAPDVLLSRGPSVRALDVVSDGETRSLLESGFPTRMHFRLELWSAGRVFDALRDRREWEVFIYYDALGKRYRVVNVGAEDEVTSAGQFGSFDEMIREIERPMNVTLRARRQRERQYYIAVVEVESMSLTDLDELARWMRGEMQPAVRGDGNPGTALGRGLRRIFVRLLGAERRNLQARSRTFLVLR